MICWFYIDAQPAANQVVGGTSGVAVLPRNDVLGITGVGQEPLCRWIGGLGHELGHAFGLDHPADCESKKEDSGAPECQSLMYLGYLNYSETLLTQQDKIQLDKNPFFSAANAAHLTRKCSN